MLSKLKFLKISLLTIVFMGSVELYSMDDNQELNISDFIASVLLQGAIPVSSDCLSDAWEASPILNTHIKSGSVDKSREGEIICPWGCDSIFKTKCGLRLHYERAHAEVVRFRCNPCGYTTNIVGDMRRHVYTGKHKSRGVVGEWEELIDGEWGTKKLDPTKYCAGKRKWASAATT